MIATTLGIIATALGVIRAWPQVLQIAGQGRTAGVSVQTWAMTLLNNATWLTLGVIIAALPIVVSNLLSAVGCIAVLGAVAWRQQQKRIARTVGVTLAGIAVIGLTSRGGVTALTVLATMLAVSMFLPQLFTVLRSGAGGVSASTWLVTAISSGVWILYAFALGRPSIGACHVVILPASLAIAYRARRERDLEPAETSAPGDAGERRMPALRS